MRRIATWDASANSSAWMSNVGGFQWPVLPSELDDDAYSDAFTNFWSTVQDRLDAWITSAQMRAAVEPKGTGSN